MKRWFVTGTDTGVGKTHAACALVRRIGRQGYRVAGLKPVASGCEDLGEGLRNEDALALMAAANVDLPYEQVNPYAFEPAIAPHLAAAQAGVRIDPGAIAGVVADVEADWLIVEGAGGWSVPLGEDLMFADLARVVCEEVILVVGLRLGCINHALLSAEQVARDGFRLAGWVANTLDPGMPMLRENIRAIRSRLAAPLLGVLPWDRGGTAPVQWEWTP